MPMFLRIGGGATSVLRKMAIVSAFDVRPVVKEQVQSLGASFVEAEAMSAAADAEDKSEKHPVTPGVPKPARELYGVMLLERGLAKEALAAFQLCCKLEGIIPALEPSHALAHVMKIAPSKPKDHLMVMNMCGRGDKDIFTVADILGVKL